MVALDSGLKGRRVVTDEARARTPEHGVLKACVPRKTDSGGANAADRGVTTNGPCTMEGLRPTWVLTWVTNGRGAWQAIKHVSLFSWAAGKGCILK